MKVKHLGRFLVFIVFLNALFSVGISYVVVSYLTSQISEGSTVISAEINVPVPEIPSLRYGFTTEDIYLLAQLLSGDRSIDGDGEYDIDFQRTVNMLEVNKVLGVVMNRVRSPFYPDSVRAVVLQPGHFVVMPRNLGAVPSEKTLNVVREWAQAYDLYDPSIQTIPIDHLYFTGNGRINITRARYRG